MENPRTGQVMHIRDILRERNIVLKGADALSAQGFTQVPNHMLRSAKISPGAKLAYTMLLSYAWQNDYCFPGQERLGRDIGVTDRSVRTYLQELEAKGFLKIRRQGQGRPNLYELDVRNRARLPKPASTADRKIFPVKTGRSFRSRPEKSSD
jgi:DNA-binding transcriptional ArsR family regulator